MKQMKIQKDYSNLVILLSTLVASLLGSMLREKEVIRAGETKDITKVVNSLENRGICIKRN